MEQSITLPSIKDLIYNGKQARELVEKPTWRLLGQNIYIKVNGK